jgi:hypothetical protein
MSSSSTRQLVGSWRSWLFYPERFEAWANQISQTHESINFGCSGIVDLEYNWLSGEEFSQYKAEFQRLVRRLIKFEGNGKRGAKLQDGPHWTNQSLIE